MPISVLDERTLLVVVDLQNGVLSRAVAPVAPVAPVRRNVEPAAAFRAAGMPVVLVDAMTDIRAESHTNSAESAFPLLGETGTAAEVLDSLRGTGRGAA